MMIPIRATYRRSDEPGGRATFESAVYADVPVELIVGTAAQVSADLAMHAGDEENAARILRAMDRAAADGKIILMD